MADDRLHIDLQSKLDNDGNTYYIAKLKAPISIDCSDGICLLIFVADKGNEELQISSITQKPKVNNNDRNDR